MRIRKYHAKLLCNESSRSFLSSSRVVKSCAIKLFISNPPYIHKKARNMRMENISLHKWNKKTFQFAEKHVQHGHKIWFLFVLSAEPGCSPAVTLFMKSAVNWTIKLSQIPFMYESRSDLPWRWEETRKWEIQLFLHLPLNNIIKIIKCVI